MEEPVLIEKTLDPGDWSNFRRLGHRMLDDVIDNLSTLREQPAWQAMPPEVVLKLNQDLPFQGEGEEGVYNEFLNNVFPYGNGNRHPRFWGWVQGNGTPLGMMADMLAAAMNPHMAGFNQAPALVEKQVITWLAELMGFPLDASGILQSGGTMANITGLTVARHAKAGFDIRTEGFQESPRPKMIVYASTETHRWIITAVELLGLGRNAYRAVPVDSDFRINIGSLCRMISEDRANGAKPFCVIGNAGTINTGTSDDLEALAEICKEEDLWFHIDGAFGAWARIVPELRSQVRGLEKADSLAVDLHKWMYLPFEIACILVRDEKQHRQTYANTASYIADTQRGVIAGGLPFAERGIELTRGFKALKAWMSIKAYGIQTYIELVRQNVGQAHFLATLIEEEQKLELLAPVLLNTVCFRYKNGIKNQADLNLLNNEILQRIQESGVAVPSSTTINGVFALRICIVNHRSKREDFRTLVDIVVSHGDDICRENHEPPF